MRGTVKHFRDAKGYGWIQSDEHDDDIFVHYSQIASDGFKTLKAGEVVEFVVARSPKGLHAEDVIREDDL